MTRKPWRWGVGALIGCSIALLGACDGSNLFDAEQNPFAAPRVAVSVPDGAFAGDTIGISISASSALDLATIDVAIRGAVTKDTSITVTSGRNLTSVIKVGLPTILTDTMLIVAAVATDKNGNVSKVRSDTTTVLGPPAIISVTGPDSLRLGATSTLRIRAFGSRRITQLDIAMRGAISKDTTIFIVPPVNDVTQNVAITLPAVAADTSVRVSIVAKDVSRLSSVTAGVSVPLAISPPVASINGTITGAQPGALMTIPVRATAMRQVSAIKVELRGATTMDETITITPASPDVTRDVTIRLPGDLVDSNLTVRAYAIDKAGTVSAPATANITLTTGVPTVQSVACTSCTGTSQDSVRSGGVVDVRVTAEGSSPLKEIRVRFRGAVNNEIVHPVPNPAPNPYTAEGISVTLPVEVGDTLLTITAVAVDQGNRVSAITAASTKIVRVADATAPTVTAQASPGATTAGSTIQIRVNARDNVGVRRIGYAVVNPGGDTIGGSPTLVNTSGLVKDTTFSFIVPSTITPRTVRVLGIAQDASGRRGLSPAVNVVVADSAAPTMTFIAPTLNSTLPLNDSVRVQIRVQDPTGVKEVRLRGESVRVDSLGPTQTIQRFAEKVITFPINPGAPLPTDTTIVRYLNAIPDSISEPVSIIATATDSLSNRSTASTTVLVGGPRVELRNPVPNTGVVPGGTLLLTGFALDRSAGIDSVRLAVTGAQTATFMFRPGCAPATCAPNGLSSNDSVVINQNYTVGAATGTITVQATAWNRNRIAGVSSPVSVNVSSTAVSDVTPPQVRVAISSNDRIELEDTVTLNVSAQDIGAAGLRRVGVVITATPAGGIAPRTIYRDSLFTGSGRTGVQPAPFKFTLADFGFTEQNLIRLPRTVTFNVHAFARDTVGNCGANVTNTMAALACDSVQVLPAPTPSGETWWYTARNTSPLSHIATVVPGFARALPTGSTIADVLVDNNAARPRMYLSNQSFNRVEVLNLQDSAFASAVSVGSEPWGLFLNNAGDRLMVANSGGTNISMVDVTQPVGSIAEVSAERILTPNAVLFDATISVVNGLTRYSVTAHDFSDRPQFVAQDAGGVILYSTKPTGAAPDGTVRQLTTDAPRRESKILFNRNAINSAGEGVAIAHIDSIVVERNALFSDRIQLYDHTPGNPAAVIASGFTDLRSAIDNLKAGGSDIADFGGSWKIETVGLSDTTFITTSGDRQFVGFGEGGTGSVAQVWIWAAGTQSVSDDISVADLVGNASEEVLGIALNQNGQIGAARGSQATSFFSNDANFEGQLRLQGRFSTGVAGGNGGVALHPSHNTALVSNSTTLAFIATVNRSIKIVDTFSFRERGEIQIRDNIVGALRAALPLAAENVGLMGTCDEILVKLYGVTGAGNAVIINVRAKDVVVNPPNGVCPT